MSMIDRSLDGMAFLSGQLGAMLQRRLRELGGIALLSLAMIAALALATWSVDDPSLSHATDSPRAQSARPSRRDRCRSDDAAPGIRLAGAAVADRGVGLSAAWPSAASPRAVARAALAIRRGACGRVCIVSAARHSLAVAVRTGRRGRRRDAALAGRAFRHAAQGNIRSRRRDRAWCRSTGRLWRRCGNFLARLAGRGQKKRRLRREADAEEDGAWISLGRLMHTVLSFRSRFARMFRRRRGAGSADGVRARRRRCAEAGRAALRRPSGRSRTEEEERRRRRR